MEGLEAKPRVPFEAEGQAALGIFRGPLCSGKTGTQAFHRLCLGERGQLLETKAT